MNCSLIFYSLTFAKTSLCYCKYNSCVYIILIFQRRKDALESLETASSSTSAKPKPKRKRRNDNKLPSRSSPLLSTQEEPVQAVEAMDISGPVEMLM